MKIKDYMCQHSVHHYVNATLDLWEENAKGISRKFFMFGALDNNLNIDAQI